MMNPPALSMGGILIIALSFLLALLLSILPVPGWILLVQPPWLTLIVIYWVVAVPHRVSLGIAWLLGLLLDALYGTLLGEHALALCVVAYLAQRLHRQIRMFPLTQQAMSVFLLVIIYQIVLLWIQGIIGQLNDSAYWFCVPALTSMLFWPWIAMLLRYYQRRFRIY